VPALTPATLPAAAPMGTPGPLGALLVVAAAGYWLLELELALELAAAPLGLPSVQHMHAHRSHVPAPSVVIIDVPGSPHGHLHGATPWPSMHSLQMPRLRKYWIGTMRFVHLRNPLGIDGSCVGGIPGCSSLSAVGVWITSLPAALPNESLSPSPWPGNTGSVDGRLALLSLPPPAAADGVSPSSLVAARAAVASASSVLHPSPNLGAADWLSWTASLTALGHTCEP